MIRPPPRSTPLISAAASDVYKRQVSDYSTGTNHLLPCYGSSKFSSGLNVNEFIKKISVVTLSKLGVEKIGNPAITLSEFEQLNAHTQSIKSRMKRRKKTD